MATVEFKPNNDPNKFTTKYSDRAADRKKIFDNVELNSGDIVAKKPTLGNKIKDSIVADSIDSIKNYIVKDVIIPQTINLLSTVLHSTIDAIFGGRSAYNQRSSFRSGINEQWNYNGYSKTSTPTVSINSQSVRSMWRDFPLTDYTKAQEIIDTMQEAIEMYQNVTCYELCEKLVESARLSGQLAGRPIDIPYTYQDWGWVDLSDARPKYTRNGYILDLPRPIYLGRV